MATKQHRPGRTLTLFFTFVALLVVLASLGGTWKPALGLDLQGGTQITLVADPKFGAPTSSQMDEAASIIDQRVNGSGVSEASVATQGSSNIVVEIPGKNRRDLVSAVERTAQLRFRLVAQCPQLGGPCMMNGRAQPKTKPGSTSSGAPSSGPSAGSSATPSPSATSTQSVKPKATAKPKRTARPKATAKPNPRVAPDYSGGLLDKRAKKASSKAPASAGSKPSPSETPTSAPSSSPTAPASAAPSAPVSDPMQWMDHPDPASVVRFLHYKCPPKGRSMAPVLDDPKKPLVTCDDQGVKYLLSSTVIEGTSLKTASFGIPQGSTGWAVDLTLKGDAVKKFADISSALAGTNKQFAIVLDGKVLSAPTFNSAILDGSAQISGNFTQGSAQSLANSLKYGALPIHFAQPPTVQTIGPSLAGNQLSGGILAGIIGLTLVVVFCLLYYRGLGLVVVGSLVVAGILTYSVVLILSKAAGFTLTLPGIAGLIVAVGITSDSFIVYFERIRDEMRSGRSMRVSVETGWQRARHTALAADGVSLLAAVVLYIFAIGVVKGFAFALGISTLIDLAVFFWFTKPCMTIAARRRFFNSGGRMSGLSRESLGLANSSRPGIVEGKA